MCRALILDLPRSHWAASCCELLLHGGVDPMVVTLETFGVAMLGGIDCVVATSAQVDDNELPFHVARILEVNRNGATVIAVLFPEDQLDPGLSESLKVWGCRVVEGGSRQCSGDLARVVAKICGIVNER